MLTRRPCCGPLVLAGPVARALDVALGRAHACAHAAADGRAVSQAQRLAHDGAVRGAHAGSHGAAQLVAVRGTPAAGGADAPGDQPGH